MTNKIALSIILAAMFVGGAIYLSSGSGSAGREVEGGSEGVSVENGVQMIDLAAKGGYYPKKIVAKAGIPTTLRVRTKNTFDCSSALIIPSIKYQKNLSSTGEELITIPVERATGTLRGTCSMGMYGFEIAFR
ncbi:MAG: hypothetical protein AAB495_04205 [Patescibacteria group bacterium]